MVAVETMVDMEVDMAISEEQVAFATDFVKTVCHLETAESIRFGDEELALRRERDLEGKYVLLDLSPGVESASEAFVSAGDSAMEALRLAEEKIDCFQHVVVRRPMI